MKENSADITGELYDSVKTGLSPILSFQAKPAKIRNLRSLGWILG